jgi:L-arabinokinase
LGWDACPTVLVSFGGLGLPDLDPGVLGLLSAYRFVLPDASDTLLPDNVCVVAEERLQASGLDYVDLVGAVDVVFTKPGYGIVSDCIAAGTRLVYVERGDFPEYDVFVAEMPRWLACERVVSRALQGERGLDPQALGQALDRVLVRPRPARPDVQGAIRAARRLLEWTPPA